MDAVQKSILRLCQQQHAWMLEQSEFSNVFYLSRNSPVNGDSLLCLVPGIDDDNVESLFEIFEAEKYLYTTDFDVSMLLLADYPGSSADQRRLLILNIPKDIKSMEKLF